MDGWMFASWLVGRMYDGFDGIHTCQIHLGLGWYVWQVSLQSRSFFLKTPLPLVMF